MKRSQQGVILMIALIMLVSMTLAGIALVRSVDTTNLIAGNLAFKESALNATDRGVQEAITWLESKNTGTNLHFDNLAAGYSASRAAGNDPVVLGSWDDYWTTSLETPGKTKFFGEDASTNNKVYYAIERLCNAQGDPVSTGRGCAVSQSAGTTAGSSKGAGVVALLYNSQVYYRITSKVVGPRNTISFVQTVVAM